jgi:ParB family chromosome partitioning protein
MVTKKPKGLGMGLEALLGPRVRDGGEAPPVCWPKARPAR